MSFTETAETPEVRTAFNQAREAAELITVGGAGVQIANFAQQVDMAKWIAKGGFAIPAHLRDNVGACLAVLDMSQRWGFSVYQVAKLCYVVNDQLAFMAQLVVAVINKFAPLEGRLRYVYEGEGDNRICIVTGTPKGETEPLEYRSPPVGKITPKNSPLWKSDVDQQLGYMAGTRFCRRHFPEILVGIYSPEELLDGGLTPHMGAENAKDITPGATTLADRLKAGTASTEGFRDGVVEAGLNGDLDGSHGAAEGAGEGSAGAPATKAPKSRKRTTAAPAKDAGVSTAGATSPTSNVADGTQPIDDAGGQPDTSADTSPDEKIARATALADAKAREAGGTLPADPIMPKNLKQYTAWFQDWLAGQETADDIKARWNLERKLRNDCGITAEDREPLEKMKAARVAELKG